MKTWVRKTLSVGVLAAGALLFGPGVAHADVRQQTSNNNGILNGAQLVAPVSVPVNIVGNAIGVAGEASAAGFGVNRTEGGKVTQKSSHNNGIGNGLQAYLPVNVPINVVGNAVAVLGQADAAGAGINGRKAESASVTEGGMQNGHGWGDQVTGNNNGILNGTQIYAPVEVPINVCGNALSLIGQASAQALCANGHGRTESGWGGHQVTGNNNGILNGAQIYAPISLPVNLAGNSIAVLGQSNAAAAAHNESAHGDGLDQTSKGNNGIGNGLQVAAPINAPINVCGNALSIVGQATAAASCTNGHGGVQGDGGHGHGHHHNGNGAANGADDDQYMGAGGAQGGYHHNDDVAGDNGDNYGQGRSAKSAEAASPVAGLTKNASSVGGLELLKALG
jgi:ChpA-C